MSVDYHLRHAPQTRLSVEVTVEGKRPEADFSVYVSGQLQNLRYPVPIGYRRIFISAPDCEPNIQNRFIWYGVNDLGSVDLPRSTGSVIGRILPTPDSYELSGRYGSWTNESGSFTNVPVGRYQMVSRFGSLFERVEMRIPTSVGHPFRF